MTIVQFHHPINEHNPNPKNTCPGGYMPWLHLGVSHAKKFVNVHGRYKCSIDEQEPQNGELGLWTEWEGPSLYEIVRTGGKVPIHVNYPCNIHNIIGEKFPKIAGLHAVADPYLISSKRDGDNPVFYYSHCGQHNAKSGSHYLSSLEQGDLILFGRLDAPRDPQCFVLDCVFVVYNSCPYIPSRSKNLSIPDHFRNYVMEPLRFSSRRHASLILYKGVPFALRNEGECDGMFSFFPCKALSDNNFTGFPEITIPLDLFAKLKINFLNATGQISCNEKPTLRRQVWELISNHVISHEYRLGVSCLTDEL